MDAGTSWKGWDHRNTWCSRNNGKKSSVHENNLYGQIVLLRTIKDTNFITRSGQFKLFELSYAKFLPEILQAINQFVYILNLGTECLLNIVHDEFTYDFNKVNIYFNEQSGTEIFPTAHSCYKYFSLRTLKFNTMHASPFYVSIFFRRFWKW